MEEEGKTHIKWTSTTDKSIHHRPIKISLLRGQFKFEGRARVPRTTTNWNRNSIHHFGEEIVPVEGDEKIFEIKKINRRAITIKVFRRSFSNAELAINQAPELPVVFCAGLFGFDSFGPFSYWRGISKYLIGQVVTRVPPTASIEDRARHIKERIEKLIEEIETNEKSPYRTPLFMKIKKVHLIGHSMGGLDCRYYISKLGGHERAYTLTTLGTPHRGSWVADWSLKNIGERLKVERILKAMNIDTAAFHQLTTEYLEKEFNPNVLNHPGVKYYSYAGAMRVSRGSLMRLFYKPLQRHEGANDGLVSLRSAKWGTFEGSYELDHMDLMNWNRLKDTRFLYREIVKRSAASEYEKPVDLSQVPEKILKSFPTNAETMSNCNCDDHPKVNSTEKDYLVVE